MVVRASLLLAVMLPFVSGVRTNRRYERKPIRGLSDEGQDNWFDERSLDVELLSPKNGKGKGKGSPSCKSGTPTTCAPSASPSIQPTTTPFPTRSPTTSVVPTSSPTKEPTPSPSASPTDFPTPSPTSSPTDYPSATPSTPFPTTKPSASPTDEPSAEPTPTPSAAPTTPFPTIFPSAEPSDSPSVAPTPFPTVSAAPSEINFLIIPVDNEGNPITDGNNSTDNVGVVSTCPGGGEDKSGSIRTLMFSFQYVGLLDPTAVSDDVVKNIETLLHKRLGLRFLTCLPIIGRLLSDSSYTWVTRTSSLPVDKVSDDSCTANETETGFSCYVVDAGFTMDIVPAVTTTDEGTARTLGDFLSQQMDGGDLKDADELIHKLSLRGFPDSEVLVSETPTGDDPSAAAATGFEQDSVNTGGIIGGTVAIIAAAVIATMVAFFIMRKRRQSQEYLKHLEENGSLYSIEIDTEGGTSKENSPARAMVITGDDAYSGEDSMFDVYEEDGDPEEWNHDVKTCKSSTCQICQERKLKKPMFVPAAIMAADVERDLAPIREKADKRSYPAPDTIDL